MGVPQKDIVRINLRDLWEYNGDEVILPIVSVIAGFTPLDRHELPSSIEPIFISCSTKVRIGADEVAYLKKYEPVGCRDRFTANELKRHGVQAYVNGCISVTLPKRMKPPINGRVFLVDISNELRQCIPHHIVENAIETSHNVREYNGLDQLNFTKYRLERYINEARLVVTPKLHCATPCMASGIPVVLALDEVDTRFTFIDSILPVYTKGCYEDIDWETSKPVDIEEHKRRVIRLITSRLNNNADLYGDIKYIDQFYRSKNLTKIEESEYSCIKNVDKELGESFYYSLYGAGGWYPIVKRKMQEKYPNSWCVHVYDQYKHGTTVDGMLVEDPKEMIVNLDEYCLITIAADQTRQEVLAYFDSLGKPRNSYAFAVLPR
jgi:hypothetical protein